MIDQRLDENYILRSHGSFSIFLRKQVQPELKWIHFQITTEPHKYLLGSFMNQDSEMLPKGDCLVFW